MADNDIYHSKERFENFERQLSDYTFEPNDENKKRKYWIKNKDNVKHFRQLFKIFDIRDTSYIRRLRLSRTFLIVSHVLSKDLAEATRDDINDVIVFGHKVNLSPKSKRDFALDIKFVWRQLFPEKDDKGRVDDTIFPYAVRHLNGKTDKSKEKMRGDKFSIDEFEQLVASFADDIRMQAYLTIMSESLARPQELLGRKIKDVELFDNYAKIYISEHGKEGVGFLRIIDSYYYLSEWLNKHPQKKNPEAFLFVNFGDKNRYYQMNPFHTNHLIRERCKRIGINKPITNYSFKRNGVTMMRLQGKSDLDIQHTARWTSTKQLKTYDMSNQEESFKIELIKRGIIKADKSYKEYTPTTKRCFFCDTQNGIAETFCSKCNRPLDRKVIEKEIESKENDIDTMKNQIADLLEKFNDLQTLKESEKIKLNNK